MTTLQVRDKRAPESPWSRLDRLLDEWMRTPPMRRLLGGEAPREELIRVDEYRQDDTQVIRAELPGIDPEKDVELTVSAGMLTIHAERRIEQKSEKEGWTRRELRYGSFTRSLPLAPGASEDDIKADYKDGVLEIRVPVAEPAAPAEPRKIAVSHS